MTATLCPFVDFDATMLIADGVARAHGLGPVLNSIAEPDPTPVGQDEDFHCGRCCQLVPPGHPTHSRRVSYYEDEWESYCSQFCADYAIGAEPGSVFDFLERMGWTVWWIEEPLFPDFKWRKVLDIGVVIATEGDETWRADMAWAERLHAEVKAVTCG